MCISNKSGFVSTIILDCKNKINSNCLISWGCIQHFLLLIIFHLFMLSEHLIRMYGVQFSLCGIIPFTIVVSFVKFQSFSIISWFEKAKHMFLCMPDLSYFRLLYGSGKLLFLFDEMSKPFPSIKVV